MPRPPIIALMACLAAAMGQAQIVAPIIPPVVAPPMPSQADRWRTSVR